MSSKSFLLSTKDLSWWYVGISDYNTIRNSDHLPLIARVSNTHEVIREDAIIKLDHNYGIAVAVLRSGKEYGLWPAVQVSPGNSVCLHDYWLEEDGHFIQAEPPVSTVYDALESKSSWYSPLGNNTKTKLYGYAMGDSKVTSCNVVDAAEIGDNRYIVLDPSGKSYILSNRARQFTVDVEMQHLPASTFYDDNLAAESLMLA